MLYKLEVIAFNIQSCIAVNSSGAHRIELCDNPAEGGTTPSYGLIKSAREAVSIDLFPIIRPRGGDFLYTAEEFEVMKADVKLCRDLGCDGVVFGLLTSDGSVDIKRTALLRELAYPMDVTFHRAFDYCSDPFNALEVLIEIGCQRILTSGQQPVAMQGAELIRDLVKAADDRIIIMPGSGIRKENIKELAGITGASEYHSSLRERTKSKMDFQHPAFKHDADSFDHTGVNAAEIAELLRILA